MSRYMILFGFLILSYTQTFASQNGGFDPSSVFEGMVYKDLYTSQVMVDPRFEPVLEREGLIKGEQTNPAQIVLDEDDLELDRRISSIQNLEEVHLLEEVPINNRPILTSQDLDDALAAEFKRKKARSMAKTLLRPGFLMLMESGVFGGGIWILNSIAPTTMNFAVGIAGFVILELASRNLNMVFNTVWYLAVSPLGDPLRDLEETYARKKRFFSPQLQERIERKFQDARKEDMTGSKKDFLETVLKMPVHSKKPKIDLMAFRTLLAGYQDTEDGYIADVVTLAAINHLARYTEKVGPNKAPKLVLYIEGPPGLGKTRFVRHLAKAMGHSLICLQISDERFRSTAEEAGTLLQAIMSAEERNPVLCVDEFDRVANQDGAEHMLNMLLPFIDPSIEGAFDPYMKEDLDLSHPFLIALGNNPLKDSALLDRALVLKIKLLEKPYKDDAVRKDMLPVLMASDIPELSCNWGTLSREAQEAIRQTIEKDTEVGFRTIQKKLQMILNKERMHRLFPNAF